MTKGGHGMDVKEQVKVSAVPADWSARWIGGRQMDHRAWTEIRLEVSVSIEKGGADVLFGVRDEANYYGLTLNSEALTATVYRMENGQQTVWSEVGVPELAGSATAQQGPSYVTSEAVTGGEAVKVAVCIERTQEAVRILIDSREIGRVQPQAHDWQAGTIGFATKTGQEAVFRELRVFDPEGRAQVVNRFYDPACLGFSAGTIDRTGSGLRLGESQLALCESPIAVDQPLLRTTFNVPPGLVRATVRVYAIGWYELHLNGRKLDDRVLAPANSPYERRMLYDVYDATAVLQEGVNAIGLSLGNGYNINYSRWGWKWKRDKAAVAVLELELVDGRMLQIGTDEDWRTTDGPLLQQDIYDGETCDGRRSLALAGWTEAGYDESGSSWQPAVVVESPPGVLEPHTQPPIRPSVPLAPVKTAHPSEGVTVYDFGQNIAGWARVDVSGEAGSQVTLRYSELVDETGAIDPWTNRNARATDRYILHGQGLERYEPTFTYHGFRYVEVTGEAELHSIEAVPIRSDVRATGSFRCSNALLTGIQSNLRWSVLNNLVSIPTDCCQRDERTPCMMDSAVVEEAAMHNFDMREYYIKWLGDISDSATNPDWSGDKVTLPWYLYWHYDDKETLAAHYGTMRGYVDHVAEKWPDLIVTDGFGDWCPPNEDGWEQYFREVEIVNTTLAYQQASVVSQAAGVLGRADDERHYAAHAERIRQAFQDRFHKGEGRYGSGTQTSQVMPLALGLVPDMLVEQAVQQLVAAIQEKDGHLDTGIYATRYLVDVLADHGHMDLAYSLLTRTTYPSFGWQIAQGATTLWEQWSFKGGMHSLDHAMFAGVGTSFYTRIAGIRPLSPGYRQIEIRPYAPVGLDWAEGSLETAYGRIVAGWRREAEELILEVEIPPGTSANVALPQPDGELLELARGIGEGQHRFVVPVPVVGTEA
ncbi:alpha-L-rhamnosidase [Paenibacillus daejeonensis]|uniref:alpha-L-rhamnosidase n=1 Tax=Paenibacillus daejeonensis TaxID=135193 RepID=UPI00037D4DAD|nr:alpha-L-rhamnosidase [Paenibacillus daejeonensis]